MAVENSSCLDCPISGRCYTWAFLHAGYHLTAKPSQFGADFLALVKLDIHVGCCEEAAKVTCFFMDAGGDASR